MTTLSPTRPRARKPHRCDLCPDPIEPGTVYERWGWVGEDTVSTVKVHTGCWALIRAFAEPSYDHEGFVIDDDALNNALSWDEPTRDECVSVGGEQGGRAWDRCNPSGGEDA